MFDPAMIDVALNETNTSEMESGKESICLARSDLEQLTKLREQLRGLILPEPEGVRVTPILKHSIDVRDHESIRQGMRH